MSPTARFSSKAHMSCLDPCRRFMCPHDHPVLMSMPPIAICKFDTATCIQFAQWAVSGLLTVYSPVCVVSLVLILNPISTEAGWHPLTINLTLTLACVRGKEGGAEPRKLHAQQRADAPQPGQEHGVPAGQQAGQPHAAVHAAAAPVQRRLPGRPGAVTPITMDGADAVLFSDHDLDFAAT